MIEVIEIHDNFLEGVYTIREKVFVEEQNVSKEEEYDEFELASTHLLASIDEKPVGTCRIRKTKSGVKLERFAVLKNYRKMGVGKALLKKCLEILQNESYIYLHAQVQVVDFYSSFGFEVFGNEFVEANILHRSMHLKKTR